MKFRKMHGLGNDFVIFDARQENIFLTPEDMRLIADRHWGVGCDLITVMDLSEKADIQAFFFNSDGSDSAVCGNATRCIADIIMSESGKDSCTIESGERILECHKKGDMLVQVNMGRPEGIREYALAYGGVENPVAVDMGNPHLVFFVDDLDVIDIEKAGSFFENHEMFPERTNVEFVQLMDKKNHIRQKTWERGCGITQACGSGACAVIAAANYRDLVNSQAEIELDGGVLQMEIIGDGNILMSGAVAYVFDGVLYDG